MRERGDEAADPDEGEATAPRFVSALTRATHGPFREASERYGMDAGEMTVCKIIEDDAGIDLRVAGEWEAPWTAVHPGDREITS